MDMFIGVSFCELLIMAGNLIMRWDLVQPWANFTSLTLYRISTQILQHHTHPAALPHICFVGCNVAKGDNNCFFTSNLLKLQNVTYSQSRYLGTFRECICNLEMYYFLADYKCTFCCCLFAEISVLTVQFMRGYGQIAEIFFTSV